MVRHSSSWRTPAKLPTRPAPMVSELQFAAATLAHGDDLLGDKLQPAKDLWIGTGRRFRQREWDPGDRIQEVGAGSQSHGDRSDRDLEDHRSQADEEEWRIHFREADERWRAHVQASDEWWESRMRAFKERLNSRRPSMEEDPPEPPHCSPLVRSNSQYNATQDCWHRNNKDQMFEEEAPFEALPASLLGRSPMVRSNSQGMKANPGPPKFNSTTAWDVIDDDMEEDEDLLDDDDWSEEDNEEVESSVEKFGLEKDDDDGKIDGRQVFDEMPKQHRLFPEDVVDRVIEKITSGLLNLFLAHLTTAQDQVAEGDHLPETAEEVVLKLSDVTPDTYLSSSDAIITDSKECKSYIRQAKNKYCISSSVIHPLLPIVQGCTSGNTSSLSSFAKKGSVRKTTGEISVKGNFTQSVKKENGALMGNACASSDESCISPDSRSEFVDMESISDLHKEKETKKKEFLDSQCKL